MVDPEKKICRYFNTLGGCWYGDSCKFLHIPNKKPPCKFYGSSTGCRYGESCHFSHDRTPFKSVENYNNPPSELIKKVFKENMDPSELSGTNNNNMTQPISGLSNSDQQQQQQQMGVETHNSTEPCTTEINRDSSKMIGQNQTLSTTTMNSTTNMVPITSNTNSNSLTVTVATTATSNTSNTNVPTTTNTNESINLICTNEMDVSLDMALNNEFVPNKSMTSTNSETNLNKSSNSGNDLTLNDSIGNGLTNRTYENQNFALTALNGRPNGLANEIEIYCGSCKKMLERRGNESYCTLLKDHYLECFLDKEGDHVKYVKTKAALEPGQMYWCKSCILIFEKPWSLFQHMADKAKGSKVQRWEKKIHLDWMDSVAGLMAGYDLGLFSPAKLRVDLRNLLADQHTMEEEMEAAAVTAAAMMQWLAPLSSPWRLQQREMMRKIEQLNRQMLRKANIGLNGPGNYNNFRAALAGAPASLNSPTSSYGLNSRSNINSLPATPAPSASTAQQSRISESIQLNSLPTSCISMDRDSPVKNTYSSTTPINDPTTDSTGITNDLNPQDQPQSNSDENPACIGPVGDSDCSNSDPANEQTESQTTNTTGASGDVPLKVTHSDSKPNELNDPSTDQNNSPAPDTNNTNVTLSNLPSARGDDGGRRMETRRTIPNASTIGHYSQSLPGFKSYNTNTNASTNLRLINDHPKYPNHGRGTRYPSFGHNLGLFGSNHRNMHRLNRTRSNLMNGPPPPPTQPPQQSQPSNRSSNSFNPPSFHASLDFNFGFTNDEVEELLSQGIKPWDSEASAALAVLRGEMDHLLD